MKVENIYNNLPFLEKINPLRVVIYAFGIWSLLFFTAPLVITIDLNYEVYGFLFFSFVVFFIGGSLNKSRQIKQNAPINNEKLGKLFKIVIILASIGLALKLVDRFLIRGISIDSDYFANRESMEQAGGNALGIVTSFLIPFGYIPLFLFWRYKLKFKLYVKIIIYAVFFVQLFDAFLIGSRSSIFVTAVFFALYIFYFKKFTFTFRKSIILIASALAFLLLMNYIFLERTKLFAGDKAFEIVLSQSNFNYTLTSTQEFKQNFNSLNAISQTAAFTYITTVQYFTHGMIELSYLYDNFEGNYAVGKYTFATYFRFLSKFTTTELDLKEIQQLAPREGVYTTLLGPLYIDFGWFTILFMFFFGRFTFYVFSLARAGYDWAILMYFFLFIVLMFAPVFNFINGAGGIFIFTCITLFNILSKKFYKNEEAS